MIILLIHAHHWHWNHPLSCQITNCVPTFWCRLPLQEFNVILLTSLVTAAWLEETVTILGSPLNENRCHVIIFFGKVSEIHRSKFVYKYTQLRWDKYYIVIISNYFLEKCFLKASELGALACSWEMVLFQSRGAAKKNVFPVVTSLACGSTSWFSMPTFGLLTL